jgi:hypothetical protein
MEPEIIVGILAVFVSGGALGAGGALLGQWVLRRVTSPASRQVGSSSQGEVEQLKAELADMATRLHSVDTRLDFTEQLLGGALLGSAAPEALPVPVKSEEPAAERSEDE